MHEPHIDPQTYADLYSCGQTPGLQSWQKLVQSSDPLTNLPAAFDWQHSKGFYMAQLWFSMQLPLNENIIMVTAEWMSILVWPVKQFVQKNRFLPWFFSLFLAILAASKSDIKPILGARFTAMSLLYHANKIWSTQSHSQAYYGLLWGFSRTKQLPLHSNTLHFSEEMDVGFCCSFEKVVEHTGKLFVGTIMIFIE